MTKAVAQATIVRWQTLADGTWRAVVDFTDPADAMHLVQMGSNLSVAVAALGKVERTASVKGPYSSQAADLHRSGFFRAPDVWAAAGTPEDYRKWLHTQECAVHGKHSCPPENYDSTEGVWRVEACHVPVTDHDAGIELGGTGWKKRYGMIPLCHTLHHRQHANGQSAVAPDEQWIAWAVKYLERWSGQAIKATLGHEHWYDVPPGILLQWADQHGLTAKLPASYTE